MLLLPIIVHYLGVANAGWSAIKGDNDEGGHCVQFLGWGNRGELCGGERYYVVCGQGQCYYGFQESTRMTLGGKCWNIWNDPQLYLIH